MIIHKIKCKKFKNLKDIEVSLDDTVFVKGAVGSGKTSLALESILFAVWGYTPKERLSDLPTRGASKSCMVEVEITKNGKAYRIIRKYPTYLAVYQDNQQLKFNTSREAQAFLDSVFGDRNNFMKFRIIDKNIGDNFLEAGQVALKKILFSNSDEVFNNMRNKLTEIKRDREIYNKDTALISPHYPSEERLDILEIGIQKEQKRLTKLKEQLNPIEREHQELSNKKAKIGQELYYSNSQKKQVKTNKQCYACKRRLSEEKQKEMLEELETKIDELEISVQQIIPELNKRKNLLETARKGNEDIKDRLYKLRNLVDTLEKRIKQKDYKWTAKDVEIVKRAIKELDNISSQYIVESLKTLEPIINNIIIKVGFKVEFIVNEKGQFKINLEKDGATYTYKDLSTGQRLLLQIAFMLALLLQKGEEGIIIADEGLSNLDEDNLLHVLNIFENLPFQLIICLHRFDNVPSHIQIIDLSKKGE